MILKFWPFIGVLTAGALFRIGNAMAAIVLPWLMYELSGSAAWTGASASAGLIALLVGSFLGGSLIDRFGARSVAIVAGTTSVLTVSAIPVLTGYGHFGVFSLISISVLGAFLDAPGMAAQDNKIPELARLAGLPIVRAVSYRSIANNVALLAGPALAGAVIGIVGVVSALWGTVLCGLASTLLSAACVPRERRSRVRPTRSSFGGFIFIFQDPLLRHLLAIVVITVGLSGTMISVLLPALFNTAGRPASDFGLTASALGAGAVVGALLLAAIGEGLKRHWVLGVGVTGSALVFMPLAAMPPLPIILMLAFANGFLISPLSLRLNTLLFERTPTDLRGRVQGAAAALTLTAASPMALLSGVLVEHFGASAVLLACLAGVALTGLAALYRRSNLGTMAC